MKLALSAMVLMTGFVFAGNSFAECCVSTPDAYQINYHASECTPLHGTFTEYMAHPIGFMNNSSSGQYVTCPLSFPKELVLDEKCEDVGTITRDRTYLPGFQDAFVRVHVADNNGSEDFRCAVYGVDGTTPSGYLFKAASAGSGMSSGTGVQEIEIDISGKLQAATTQYLSMVCFMPAKKRVIATHVTEPSYPSGIAGYELSVHP